MKEEKDILTKDERRLIYWIGHYEDATREKCTQEALAACLFTDERKIRKMVREIRLKGIPIASGDGGYFIAKNKEELKHTINRLYSQNREHVDLIFALEDCFKEEKESSIMAEENDPYTEEVLERMVNHGRYPEE